MLELPFDIQVYLIVQTCLGKLDRLLEDTVYAIRDVAQGTADVNYYRYEEI